MSEEQELFNTQVELRDVNDKLERTKTVALQAQEIAKDLSNQLTEWQHYASFIANAATLGVPSFAEWKAAQGVGA